MKTQILLVIFMALRYFVHAKKETSNAINAVVSSEQGILFCSNCANPHAQGSHVDAWEGYFPVIPSVVRTGEIVYAVPNNAADDLFNAHRIAGNIALIDRCRKVPVSEKVRRAQKAGAIGVIIVDDGECDQNFSECGVLGSKNRNRLFEQDGWYRWRDINIHTTLITKAEGDRIKSQMHLVHMNLEGTGMQYVMDT